MIVTTTDRCNDVSYFWDVWKVCRKLAEQVPSLLNYSLPTFSRDFVSASVPAELTNLYKVNNKIFFSKIKHMSFTYNVQKLCWISELFTCKCIGGFLVSCLLVIFLRAFEFSVNIVCSFRLLKVSNKAYLHIFKLTSLTPAR